MMALVSVPPFESFYEEHRDAVLRELQRMLGTEAEDAYQETFLRALRAYGRLKHSENLRAWVLTIARRVAVDHYRRREATPVPAEPEIDSRPAYAELGELADGLPRKERAAVVLRYGYDLSYAAIGAALGSSEDAARQAASSGVRRLRRRNQ
jgi:RNA polymerase sigma factor (sigma-70 family)